MHVNRENAMNGWTGFISLIIDKSHFLSLERKTIKSARPYGLDQLDQSNYSINAFQCILIKYDNNVISLSSQTLTKILRMNFLYPMKLTIYPCNIVIMPIYMDLWTCFINDWREIDKFNRKAIQSIGLTGRTHEIQKYILIFMHLEVQNTTNSDVYIDGHLHDRQLKRGSFLFLF